jgi:hypothetical protein
VYPGPQDVALQHAYILSWMSLPRLCSAGLRAIAKQSPRYREIASSQKALLAMTIDSVIAPPVFGGVANGVDVDPRHRTAGTVYPAEQSSLLVIISIGAANLA